MVDDDDETNCCEEQLAQSTILAAQVIVESDRRHEVPAGELLVFIHDKQKSAAHEHILSLTLDVLTN